MAQLFNISEVIRFAVEKEKTNIDMYKEYSDRANTEEIKDLFEYLIQESKKHEIFYTILFEAIPKEQSIIVEDEEYHAYIQELISANESTPSLSIENITDIKTILNYAVAREKDSMLFYTNLKNHLPPHHIDKIDIVIEASKNKLNAWQTRF